MEQLSNVALSAWTVDGSSARLREQRVDMALSAVEELEAGSPISVVSGGSCTGRSGLAVEVALAWRHHGLCTIVFRNWLARAVVAGLYAQVGLQSRVRLLTAHEFARGWFPARRSGDLVIFDDADEYAPSLEGVSRALWLGSTVADAKSWPAVPSDRVLELTVCSPLVVDILNTAYPNFPMTCAPAASAAAVGPDQPRVRVQEVVDVTQAVYAAAALAHRNAFGDPGRRLRSFRLIRPELELERPDLFPVKPSQATPTDDSESVALVVDVDDELLLSRALGMCHSEIDLFVVRGISNPIVEAARALSAS